MIKLYCPYSIVINSTFLKRDLMRIIVTGLGHKRQSYRKGLIQCVFTEGEQAVIDKQHGNSKRRSRPYKQKNKKSIPLRSVW